MALASPSGPQTTAEFRLACARHKLRAFLREIDGLLTSEFPHPDGREALEQLYAHYDGRLKRAERARPSSSIADRHLAQVNESVSLHTDVLGFILRSTNVRNAFEVYVPLRRLIQQIIGKDARLITSSEWKFIPFTYPMTLDELPNYVLVGSPAGNVPLSVEIRLTAIAR